jgi:hypothetical protein
MDHTAAIVPLTATLRESVAAKVGETQTLSKVIAQRPAIRVNAAIFRLVKCIFMIVSLLVLSGPGSAEAERAICCGPPSLSRQIHRRPTVPPVQELNRYRYRN